MLPTDQIMLKEQGEKASKLKTSINQAPNGSICRLLNLQDIVIKHFGTRSARFNLFSVLYLQRNVLAYS